MPELGQPFGYAVWNVKSGREGEFVSAWEAFARWTKANQPGAEGGAYLLRDVEKPGRFITIGPWKDVGSLLDWRSKPEFKDFFRRMREICDEVSPVTLSLVAMI